MEQKIEKKFFCFLNNCISIVCDSKFSLLQRQYSSSAVNVLTNSPKSLYITNRDILQLYLPHSYEKYDKSVVVQISQVFGAL